MAVVIIPSRGKEDEVSLTQQDAVLRIERWWITFRNKRFFKILKSAICSAEHSLTYEVLRKLSPRESILLKDPAMSSKVKFRLDGSRFPPTVVFKIYSKAQSIQYISGRNLFSPKTEAAEDARQQMGNRTYYDQLVSDSTRHHQLAITELHDIGTVKDYMKYSANLDETPAIYGGRENYWRQLDLNELPRFNTSMFLRPISSRCNTSNGSTVQYTSRTTTTSLTSPQTISRDTTTATTLPRTKQGDSRERGRRLAVRRVQKMRRSFTSSDSKDTNISLDSTSMSIGPNGMSSSPNGMSLGPDDLVEEDESEVLQLYKWTQDLTLEDLTD